MSPSEITRRIKRRAFATFFQKPTYIKKLPESSFLCSRLFLRLQES
jgi:hypothetical protein